MNGIPVYDKSLNMHSDYRREKVACRNTIVNTAINKCVTKSVIQKKTVSLQDFI